MAGWATGQLQGREAGFETGVTPDWERSGEYAKRAPTRIRAQHSAPR